VAAWIPNMFKNIYLVTNHKNAKAQQLSKQWKKISVNLETLAILENI
jgi:hypothetical protein